MGYNYYFLILGTKDDKQEELEYFENSGSYSCVGIHWFFCNRKNDYTYSGKSNMGEYQYIFYFDELEPIYNEIHYKESYSDVKDAMDNFKDFLEKDVIESLGEELKVRMNEKWCQLKTTFEEFQTLKLDDMNDSNDELKNYVQKSQHWIAQGYTDIEIIYGIDF
jgi:hypothetical protein